MSSDRDGPSPHNISTEHQPEGDARKPADTLDRSAEKIREAREFRPGRDEGKAEPGGS